MLAMQIDQEIIRSYDDTNNTLTSTRRLVEEKNDKIFEKTLEAKQVNIGSNTFSLLFSLL